MSQTPPVESPRLERSIGALQSKTFDVGIIGGGITGAGIARHAAACGLSVVVLDADDFASGTSSKSTKLIHGGLRYLAMGDFKLVRESALERRSIHAMAPHLAEPVTMVVPLKSRWQRLKLRVGLALYEYLGKVAPGDRHQGWDVSTLRREEPALRADEFSYAWAYREYVTDDARLVLANLRAAVSNGATCANYVAVQHIERHRDQYFLHSTDTINEQDFAVRCRCVVNATGPWAEETLAGPREPSPDDAGPPSGQPVDVSAGVRLHLSKGVHIAVPRARLPLNHMIFMETRDKRVTFAIPRGQVTYLGTTDTTYEPGPERWPPVDSEDIQYLLEPLAGYFDGEPITAEEVVSTWAGLRPLIHQPGKSSKEMSRKDEISVSENGVITIAGGKLTGYRRMADDVMARVGAMLDRSVTLDDPLAALPGGALKEAGDNGLDRFDPNTHINHVARRYQLNEATAGRLVRMYGAEAEDVLGASPRRLSVSVFAEEVDWAVSVEGAITLEDVLYRRLRCVWFEPQELAELLPAIADHMANRLSWDPREQQRQRVAVEERIAFDLTAVPIPE